MAVLLAATHYRSHRPGLLSLLNKIVTIKPRADQSQISITRLQAAGVGSQAGKTCVCTYQLSTGLPG